MAARGSKEMSKILNAPADHLRAVLRVFCAKNEEARDTIAEHLSFVQFHCSSSTAPDSKEQKVNAPSDLELCEKCECLYFEEDNEEGECWFHDGNCEPNDESSVWDDWEDWREGPVDDPKNRYEYPEGFLWDCCNKQADAEGCKNGKHRPVDCLVAHPRPLPGSSAQSSVPNTSLAGGSKRKREEPDDVAICERCNKSFSKGANSKNACSYHPSPLQLNEQGAAWSSKTFGAPSPKDTLYHRVTYPDGFIYQCCSRDGTEPGCKHHGSHKAREDKKAR
ncbi:hypothetical protein QBC40DRAFT_267086 [Triangularia verruculosa]|uniref:Uncharacterized protein n=1 Tax=Triangularia verruculosa TaxID=2587418 RepID=A0AAN6XCM6_9PEZI|nr:hypothetical protein QBC40DRAFT_267086 [Triangularia verruculosa]